MMNKAKTFLKNRNNLFIIILVGVLLMVIAIPVKDKNEAQNEGAQSGSTNGEGGGQSTAGNGNDRNSGTGTNSGNSANNGSYLIDAESASYISEMEQKLEDMLSRMEGAGKVEVIITLSTSMEKIVEKDEPYTGSFTEEKDAEGGTRTITSSQTEEETIYSDEGGGGIPYVVKTISPIVEGVLVLAEGAGTGDVSKNITDAIGVLFDLEAHKIKVIKSSAQ